MRFLIISDVHGNLFGLDAVLKAAPPYDKVLCLGDIVGYGAHPNECCETLRERNTISLSGNHDAAALSFIDIEWFNPVAKSAILWTRDQLSKENRAWLSGLPAERDFDDKDSDGGGFQAVHGSLREPWEEYIIGPDTAAPSLELMKREICFFGHTHQTACFRAPHENGKLDLNAMEWALLPDGGALPLETNWKWLVNPGSCGQPRDGNPQARFAIFDTQTRDLQIHAIDYDWNAAHEAILAAGLPKLLGERLLRGS